MLKQQYMQFSNTRFLSSDSSGHLSEVNLKNFVSSLTQGVISWKPALIFSPVLGEELEKAI